jgi:predicted NUDIX family NTP pyrophosphohydrolase
MAALSAGILPYRILPDGSVEVLLVHPGGPYWRSKDHHAWSVAKGEYQSGQDPERAAEREFAEELGVPVPAGRRLDLGEVTQAGGKRVRVWAVDVGDQPLEIGASNHFEMEWPPGSGHRRSLPEVDRAEWAPVVLARQRLVAAQTAFLDRLLEQPALTSASRTGAGANNRHPSRHLSE